RDAAVAAFCAPRWAGDQGAEIDWQDADVFASRGTRYQIVEGDNPKSATAAAASTVKADAPTPAQWRYLNRLSHGVPEAAYAAWVKPEMTKADASRAITALQDIYTR